MSSPTHSSVADQGGAVSRAVARRVQTKLSAGRQDTYEQEADRVADVVTHGSALPASPVAAAVGSAPAPKISRRVDGGPSRKPQGREEEEPQTKVQLEEEKREKSQAVVQPEKEEQERVQSREEEEPATKLQRQAEEEEPAAKLQAQEEEEEPAAKVQLQEEEQEPATELQRQEQEEEPATKVQAQEEEEEPAAKVQLQEEEQEPATRLQRQEEEEEPATKVQAQEERQEPEGKIQRQEEEEESQTKVQRAEEERQPDEAQARVQPQKEDEEEATQAKMEARANVRDKRQFPVLDRVEGRLFENKGKGEPLDEQTRISMETSFRADFGDVRVHTGADAVGMSRELRAQAFTHGKDVFFNAGKFEPDSDRGRMLLAHELTHVVQQGAAEQKVPPEKIEQNNAKRNQAPPEPADKRVIAVEKETAKPIGKEEPGPVEKAAAGETGLAGESALGIAPATGAAPAAVAAGTGPEKPAEPKVEEAKPEKEGPPKEKAQPPKVEAKAKPPGAEKTVAKAEAKGGAVGDFLRKSTKAVFQAKKARVAKLAANEKKKEDAGAKLAQTEKAVEPPAEEGESRAKASQVETVEGAKEPEPDEAEAKKEFDSALEKAVPTTLEEVDEFKEEGKGRVVGEAVKGVVTADTQEVKGTYQEIENPPEPAPPEQQPEELPELETAPPTGPIDMGEGVVGQVQPEHTDLTEYGEESDNQLEKEGIKEEQLELVDEGDLAEAKAERKAVKSKVEEGPREVKLLEQQEKQQVNKDLQKEEQAGKQKMREERKEKLLGTRDEQKKTKSKIELKRQEVTDHINAVYQTANDTVKQKLEDLEKKSLREFEEGEKAATTAFEDNVKRRIDAYKQRRYDRFGGSLLWAKDKLFGMDDLPEVKEIFESEKSRFIAAIDLLVKKITAENKRVVQECKEIVTTARQQIEKYVQNLGPELRKAGQDAFKDIKGKLDTLDKKINEKEQELQKKLAEKREAAIKAIEEKIEKMKEEMSGLLAKLGNLILNAMIKFFKWALKKAGYPSDQVMGIIDKGKAVIKKIVTDPIGFIGNVIKAVKDGIGLFRDNIKTHLISGLVSWLTGAMSDVPITLPTTWDLKGILHLVLQILGLTWERIRKKLVKRLGEKVVRVAETTVDIVKRLVTEGPIALWEMIKDKAAEIKEKVMTGIRNWVITEVVKAAIIKLLSFLNPAGAIIQAILAIYNTIMFFVENWDRIVEFVKTVFNSIADIAMGKLSAAAKAVERALAMTIPIILNFLARLLGLSGIGKAVTKIIQAIRKPIDKVVNKVVESVAKLATKLLTKGKKAAKAVKDTVLGWLRTRKKFKSADGRSHTLLFKQRGKQAVLTVVGSTQPILDYLRSLTITNQDPNFGKYQQALGIASKLKDISTSKGVTQKQADQITGDMTTLSGLLLALGGGSVGDLPKKANWKFSSGAQKTASVSFLSTLTSRGGAPSTGGTVKGWPLLQRAGLTSKGDWKKMHLITAGVGGHGKAENYIPAPTSVNSGVARRYEKSLENLVQATNRTTRKPNVVWGKVMVEDFWPAAPTPFGNYDATTFGKTLNMKAGLHFYADRNWKTDDQARIYEKDTIPQPTFGTAPPSINSSGRHIIVAATGMSHRFGLTLLAERETDGDFSDYFNLASRMRTKHGQFFKDKAAFNRNLRKIFDAGRANRISYT